MERDVAEAMTAPYRWLARRISPDGLALTAAGWLPPTVVHAAMTELGWTRDWIGKANREDQTLPVLLLRESAPAARSDPQDQRQARPHIRHQAAA